MNDRNDEEIETMEENDDSREDSESEGHSDEGDESDYSYIAPELSPTQSNHHADSSIDENLKSLTPDIFRNPDADSEFYRKYQFATQQPLGNGKSSVYKCFNLSDDTTAYAVKVYERQVQNEISVLQIAAAKRLPGVIHLVEVLTDSKWTYLIMELIDVNLLEYFGTLPFQSSSQVFDAFNALWKIVESVHSLKYAHRRICFKNVWYMKETEQFRLIGFSNAEPITEAVDAHIDYWSFGVCIYTVLCGHPPFDLLTSNLTERIENNDFDQVSEQWTALHKEIKCFVDQLLCSSMPTSSFGQLEIITKSSVLAVNCSEQEINGNENIVAIRAVKVRNQSPNRKKVVTWNESLVVTSNVRVGGKRNHRTSILKKPLIKQPRLDNHETWNVPMIKPEEIKQERVLRKKEPVNYAQRVSVRTTTPTVSRTDAERIRIKEEKIAPPRKANKTQPNGKANKTRPRKAVKNQSEPVKLQPTKKATAKLLAEHSRPPTRPVAQANAVDTKPQFTDQAVQTNLVHISSFPKPPKIPFYCFERYDYK